MARRGCWTPAKLEGADGNARDGEVAVGVGDGPEHRPAPVRTKEARVLPDREFDAGPGHGRTGFDHTPRHLDRGPHRQGDLDRPGIRDLRDRF